MKNAPLGGYLKAGQIHQLQLAANRASESLRAALGKRSLIVLDRFSSATRICCSGPFAVSGAQPEVAFGCYHPSIAQDCTMYFSSEGVTKIRSDEYKRVWLTHMWHQLVGCIYQRQGRVALSCWFSTQELNDLCEQTGAMLLGTNALARNFLENKTNLSLILNAAQVPTEMRIPSLEFQDHVASFSDVQRVLGSSIVVQNAQESGGRGTSFVSSEFEFNAAREAISGPWRASKFIKGSSSNVTALTVPRENGRCDVYVDRPSTKAIGLQEVGITGAKSAGNDWSHRLSARTTEQLVTAAVRIGTYAYENCGLIGIWGLDAIEDGHHVYINEINARIQGTTELSGVNQLLAGIVPFYAAHLAVLAGGRVNWLPPAEVHNRRVIDCAASVGPFYIKIRNRMRRPICFQNGWTGAGLYRYGPGETLAWHSQNHHPGYVFIDQGLVLLANFPRAGVTCMPGAEIGTIEGCSTKPVFDGSALTSLGKSLVSAVYELLDKYA